MNQFQTLEHRKESQKIYWNKTTRTIPKQENLQQFQFLEHRKEPQKFLPKKTY